MIQSPCSLGLLAPELCQTYVQHQAEEESFSLIAAKPTIVNKPALVTGNGSLCAFNRWVTENPILSAAGLLAGFFLLREKR